MSAVQELPLDPAPASGQNEATSGDPVVLGDASNRNLRHTLHRNNMERAICQRQTRHLDSQRKTIKSQLDREEKELRHQLQRLHQEQRVLSRLDSLQDEYLLHNVCRANIAEDPVDDDVPTVEEPEVTVVNPYPVALRRQDQEESAGQHPPRKYHARRRVSVEFEDLELQTSTGKMFPPLSAGSKGRGGRGVPPLALGLHTAVSMLSLGPSKSGSPKEKDAHFCWAGTPEAIHSVRRPRKTVARQRLDNLLVKSGSYNRSIAGNSGGQRGSQGVLGRSQSLKARGSTSSRSSLHSSMSGVSRAGSWKEGRRQHGGTATPEMGELDREALKAGLLQGRPGGGGAGDKPPLTPRSLKGHKGSPSKRHLLHRQSSSMSLWEYQRSPAVSETSLFTLGDFPSQSVTSLHDMSLTVPQQELSPKTPSMASLRDFTATPETKSCVWGTVSTTHTLEEGDQPADHPLTTKSGHSASSNLLHRRHSGKRQERACSAGGAPAPQTGSEVASMGGAALSSSPGARSPLSAKVQEGKFPHK